MSSSICKPSPRLTANTCSRFFHSWLSDLIKQSHKQRTLHLSDLYELPKSFESNILTDKLETNWFNELKRCPENPSFIRATLRTIGWKPFLLGFLLLLVELLRVAQPLLLTFLLEFFQPCPQITVWQAWLLATGTILASLFANLIFQQYFYSVVLCGIQIRLAYSGLIFRKTLRLSSQALNKFSSGEIINILSNDANKIEQVLYFFNQLWTEPLQIVLVILLFWRFVRWIAFIAVGYTTLLLIIQPLYSRIFVHFRTKILQITDERVKLMSETIKSMRIVKMYCWETAFVKRIQQIRKREIIETSLFKIALSGQILLAHSYVSITFLLIYGAMWSFDVKLDTRFYAIASCILVFMQTSVMFFFAFAIRDCAVYFSAQKRIKKFLLLEEFERDNRLVSSSIFELTNDQSQPLEKTTPSIICDLKQAKWEKSATFSLKNIVFEAYPGDLICIIGPVGSGKSSLLQTLTGEITWFDGKVRLHGSFCYVPQEPWIYSSSIKDNILFDRLYNHKLFQQVINATALDTDFLQLPHGANTLVGDHGVMLSGGQKARVNMARGLYNDADIYLLDDPLSAVDAEVSKYLFDRSIKSYLQNKICILVTHQIQFLQDATKILVLNDGEMIQIGTYDELLSTSPLFARLLEDIHQHRMKKTSLSSMKLFSKMDSIIEEIEEENNESFLPIDFETKQEGRVKWNVYISYLRAGIGVISGIILIIVIFSAQQTIDICGNWWIAQWSDDETSRYSDYKNCSGANEKKTEQIRSMNNTEWMTYRNQRFYTYIQIVLFFVIVVFIRTCLMQLIFLNAARVLHNKMFQRIIRCPISFFDSTPVGRILNRFTRDIALIDESLPFCVVEFIECFFEVFSVVIFVGVLNPWAFIPAFIAAISMWLLRNRYVPCLRDLKRIEGNTRSSIYSKLASTIYGLKVIRSYHAEKICFDEFVRQLDDNTRANYLIATFNAWAAIRFDGIALVFVACATLLAMISRISGQNFSAADIALTLSYGLNLMGIFQWTIRQSAEAETQMTSVERVLEYCQLDQEPPAQVPPKFRPPFHWPSHGQITYNNVCMSYSKEPNAPLALSHITLSIRSAEKIGIVGRTGAGKSSFIQTLFRMGTLTDGQIKIDDIDIATIGLDDLRRRISIIPQDPVLFTGTMRSNLDQFGDYSDVEIWHALEQVQLKKLVSEVLPHGLQSLVSESGSNLSVGQKQLVCLARAILKKSKILVIDEATANVDNETDELIQRSIREQFRECTVLTVAHRLRTVIDSDRIIVLGGGELLEFDSPHMLLSNPESQFSSLVEQTGANEGQHLRALARTSWLRIKARDNIFEDYSDDHLLPSREEIDPLLD